MADAAPCPKCGSPLPADAAPGTCPRCLLAAGLESGPAGGGPAAPPSPAEIQANATVQDIYLGHHGAGHHDD